MKVTALVGFAGVGFSVAPGEVADLPDDIAKDAMAAGYATAVGAKAEAGEKTAKVVKNRVVREK